MNRGVKALMLCASLASAGCTASSGELKIRPLADPGSKLRPGNERLADARAQLALGNVGLALEGFRKASREQPDSIEAFAGMAACYDAMGRYDLSRQNYEAALAIAPSNPVLLNSYAASLDHQGEAAEAASVRAEAAELASADDALAHAEAAPAERAASVTVALTPVRPSAVPAKPITAPAASVTVALPPARPVQPLGPAIPAPELNAQSRVDLATAAGPRLERLSPRVVELVTIERPVWQAKIVARTSQSTTVRWEPITTFGARPNIQLLNAARSQGLAARTRSYLLDRGWRKIAIGDASQVRDKSIVLYPASRRATGRSLAAQFGFAAGLVDKGEVMVVLLGRDAAPRAKQPRG
jgi:tetratricopeptide (TPR) repeat protein